MTLSRRRFLTIAAASVVAAPVRAAPVHRWRGVALGAPASVLLTGLGAARARAVTRAVEAEIRRLEGVFSLYRPDSELARLNREGRLRHASPDLRAVLSLSGALHTASAGAFDPTIQNRWRALAEGRHGRDAPVGWRHVRHEEGAVRFDRPGMAITLNGIAQGYITDRIAALLRREGLTGLLIDIGEVVALGQRPEGGPWRAGIADPQGQVIQRVRLSDRALATSAPMAMQLDARHGIGHILDPRGADIRPRRSLVSVSAGSAAVADGLSTALCLLDAPGAVSCIGAYRDARIESFL